MIEELLPEANQVLKLHLATFEDTVEIYIVLPGDVDSRIIHVDT
jgi:hypothetical protein